MAMGDKRRIVVDVEPGGTISEYFDRVQELLGLNMAGTLRFAILETYRQVRGELAEKDPRRLEEVERGRSPRVPDGALGGAGAPEGDPGG